MATDLGIDGGIDGGKPIIGITTESTRDEDDPRTRGKIHLNWNYFAIVNRFGGVPIIIPPETDLDVVSNLIDGWLIPGGLDMDAKHFFEVNHPSVKLQDPSRWELESALYAAVPEAMPILGICYGCQFLNVVRRGSLEQHLPDRTGHDDHGRGSLQTYHVIQDSRLGQATGAQAISGKSYHHQAVAKTGKGVKVTARHEDGTIEAIEATDRPWEVAVQWHPERTPDDPATIGLFTEFIRQAREFRAQKHGIAAPNP
jgi:putative glutamine amidotransferase